MCTCLISSCRLAFEVRSWSNCFTSRCIGTIGRFFFNATFCFQLKLPKKFRARAMAENLKTESIVNAISRHGDQFGYPKYILPDLQSSFQTPAKNIFSTRRKAEVESGSQLFAKPRASILAKKTFTGVSADIWWPIYWQKAK